MFEIDESFYEPEIRWDFKVTTERKKIWARQLEILAEFDRICAKHGLSYWLDYGTLLGAVRHQGFIPWDDDLDVCMPRPDYDRASAIMQEELGEPYEWVDLYTNLAKCTPEQITPAHMLPFAKIRNRMTTAIEPPAMPSVINQGIWIDIFPLDDAYDDKDFTPEMHKIEKELYVTAFGSPEMKEYIVSPEYTSATSKEDLNNILELPVVERFRIFEQIIGSLVGSSSLYVHKFYEILYQSKGYDKHYFDETVRIPFEGFMAPVPSRYHDLLTFWYGDYNIPVRANNHLAIYNADVSYLDYFRNPDKYKDTMKIGVDD